MFNKKIVVGSISIMLMSSAYAKPPHKPNLVDNGNRWTITAYDDASLVHRQMATQGLCFKFVSNVGSHQRYNWYSDTFPDWNGWASQEGDQIKMYGDYAKDVGHDGINWEIVTEDRPNTKAMGYGHWTEWRENGKFGVTIVFANAKLKRVGNCNKKFEETSTLPLQESAGKKVNDPMSIETSEKTPEALTTSPQ
jgi:hypothetical protein